MPVLATTFSQDAQNIIEARSRHMEAVCGIYAYYVRSAICTMEEMPPTLADMHKRHDALRREGLPWLVAVEGAEVLGYAYAGRYRARVGYQGTVETSVYVHPDHHGRRIGQALLGALVQECAAMKLRQMMAVIVDSADTAGSMRLHAHFGFQRVGVFEKVGRKFGRDIDTIILQRSLAAA